MNRVGEKILRLSGHKMEEKDTKSYTISKFFFYFVISELIFSLMLLYVEKSSVVM